MNGFRKRALLMLCVFASAYSIASAQSITEGSVPANTLKAFNSYSNNSSAKWFAGPNESYEATWEKSGRNLVYVFDQGGQLQQKKYRAAISSMPSGVYSTVSAAYPNGKIDGAYRVSSRGNQKFYELQITNANAIDRMRFDLTGKPIGKTSMAIAQSEASGEPTVAMRGASTTVVQFEEASLEEVDDDIKDLFEDDNDDADINELLNADDNWEDIELDDDIDDDSDLFEDVNFEDDEDDDGY